jgi:hypothetical protein
MPPESRAIGHPFDEDPDDPIRIATGSQRKIHGLDLGLPERLESYQLSRSGL